MSNSAVSSFPRRVFAPGFCRPSAPDSEPFVPAPRGGGAPGGASLESSRARRARRHACEAWAVPRNRDAASRRSTVALSAQGPLPSPALRPDAVRRLHAVGRFRPAAAPGVSYPRLRAAVDATPRSAIGIVSGDVPSSSEMRCLICWRQIVVNMYPRIENKNVGPRGCRGPGANSEGALSDPMPPHLPSATQRASACRSSSVMPVELPIGMLRS
jgi:hypothetical protein